MWLICETKIVSDSNGHEKVVAVRFLHILTFQDTLSDTHFTLLMSDGNANYLLEMLWAHLPWWRPVHGLAGPVDLGWGRGDRRR